MAPLSRVWETYGQMPDINVWSLIVNPTITQYLNLRKHAKKHIDMDQKRYMYIYNTTTDPNLVSNVGGLFASPIPNLHPPGPSKKAPIGNPTILVGLPLDTHWMVA